MGEQEGEGDRGWRGRDSETGRGIWERRRGTERERERGEIYGSFVRNVDLSNMKMNLIHN